MIPIKLGVSSSQVEKFDEQTNLEGQLTNLNLLDEAWEKAYIKMVAYQHSCPIFQFQDSEQNFKD